MRGSKHFHKGFLQSGEIKRFEFLAINKSFIVLYRKNISHTYDMGVHSVSSLVQAPISHLQAAPLAGRMLASTTIDVFVYIMGSQKLN